MTFIKPDRVKSCICSIVPFLFLLSFIFLFSSCYSTISENNVTQLKDFTSPLIFILSPEDGSPYSSMVVIEGVVNDSTGKNGENGRVDNVHYEVVGSLVSGTVTIDQNGSFSFQFPTTDMDGSIVILVTAEDWNGNRAESSITLVDAGNDIPTFSVSADNHQVKLDWEPVYLAESYTIYYTTNGAIPSETVGNSIPNVTAPYTISGLMNGNMHAFLLRAHSSEGRDNWSDVVKAIPLSQMTLAPDVYIDYGRIQVEWPSIQATDEFEVLRATERNGTFLPITGIIRGNSFVDSEVDSAQGYYYKVRPAFTGAESSYENFGQSSPFPSNTVEELGSEDLGYDLYGLKVTIHGNYAYLPGFSSVGGGNGGFHIVDISDPSNPTFLSTYTTTEGVASITVHNNHAYVATGTELQILDVTTPSTPIYVTSLSFSMPVGDVVIEGDYVYVAGGFGLQIYYISTPTSLQYQGEDNTAGISYIRVSGSYAYTVDYSDGFRVFDISTPTNPFHVRQVTGGISAGDRLRHLDMNSNYVYVAFYNESDGSAGIKIYDLAAPDDPSYSNVFYIAGYPFHIFSDGNYTFVSDYWFGLHVLNTNNPVDPVKVGFYGIGGGMTYTTTDGTHIYAISEKCNLHVIDLIIPSNPTIMGYHPMGDVCIDTRIMGDLAFTVSTHPFLPYGYLAVSDTSTPEDPSGLGAIGIGNSNGVESIGNYVFVASSSGLLVFDISNLPTIQLVTTYETPSTVSDIALRGDYAYISHVNSLFVIDVSIPSSPLLIGTLDFTDTLASITIRGNYAYVADTASRLNIVDISTPASPTLSGSAVPPSTGWAGKIHIKGDYAFMADSFEGFHIFNIANPSSPTYLASFTDNTYPINDIDISGNYAVAACGSGWTWNGEFLLIDMTNLVQPRLIDSLNIGEIHAVEVQGRYAYVVGNEIGLTAIDLMANN